MNAADQLDDEVAIVDHLDRICRKQCAINSRPFFAQIAHENPANAETAKTILLEKIHESLSDSAAAQ